MTTMPTKIRAITLFCDDLDESRQFYGDVFGVPVHFQDADSTVFLFGDIMINLLRNEAAVSLIEPATVGPSSAGNRMQFTVVVADVDALAIELQQRGVELLNGPVDRPWGLRTASFRDPSGHIWELAQ